MNSQNPSTASSPSIFKAFTLFLLAATAWSPSFSSEWVLWLMFGAWLAEGTSVGRAAGSSVLQSLTQGLFSPATLAFYGIIAGGTMIIGVPERPPLPAMAPRTAFPQPAAGYPLASASSPASSVRRSGPGAPGAESTPSSGSNTSSQRPNIAAAPSQMNRPTLPAQLPTGGPLSPGMQMKPKSPTSGPNGSNGPFSPVPTIPPNLPRPPAASAPAATAAPTPKPAAPSSAPAASAPKPGAPSPAPATSSPAPAAATPTPAAAASATPAK